MSHINDPHHMIEIVDHLTKEQEGKEFKGVVVNISSFLDICPTFSTTLFAFSALNDSFMKDLPEKLRAKNITLQLPPQLISLSSINPLKTVPDAISSQSNRYSGPLFLDNPPSLVLQKS